MEHNKTTDKIIDSNVMDTRRTGSEFYENNFTTSTIAGVKVETEDISEEGQLTFDMIRMSDNSIN